MVKDRTPVPRYFVRIIFSCFLVVYLVILTSSSGGRAGASGAGSTGAPCENSLACGNALCHSGNNFGLTTQEFSLSDPATNLIIEEYTPGKLYRAQIKVLSGAGTGRYGFQATALNTNLNDIGMWLNPGSNVQIATAPDCQNNMRTYVEHSSTHIFSTFFSDWRAPECDEGPVTFYFAGNKVNNNGSPTGDSGGMGDSITYNVAQVDHLVVEHDSILGGFYWSKSSIKLSGGLWMPSIVDVRTGDSVILTELVVEKGAKLEIGITDCN